MTSMRCYECATYCAPSWTIKWNDDNRWELENCHCTKDKRNKKTSRNWSNIHFHVALKEWFTWQNECKKIHSHSTAHTHILIHRMYDVISIRVVTERHVMAIGKTETVSCRWKETTISFNTLPYAVRLIRLKFSVETSDVCVCECSV